TPTPDIYTLSLPDALPLLFCLPLQYLSYYSPVNSSNIFAIRALSILYRFSFFLSCPAFAYPMFRRSHRCLLLTAASDVPDSPQPVISRIVTVSSVTTMFV